MNAGPVVVPPAERPSGCRAVPLLTEPSVGHYPEFRRFLVDTFGLDDRIGASGLLRLGDRAYELVFLGRSGQPFPSGVEIHALVPGLEPLDEDAADHDVWAILLWLTDGVDGEWSADTLATTGRVYRVPAAVEAAPTPVRETRGELLAFDLYGTLVDPLAIATELAGIVGPDDAERVAATWRRAQIDYAFRLTVMNRYQDFAEVTGRALDFALAEAGHPVDQDARGALLARYDALEPFPDAGPALRALADTGVEMVVLSNGSPAMAEACLRTSGLSAYFSRVVSVDAVRAYKPHPAVYRHLAEVTGRPVEAIRLVSCNPFDVVGAATAGMRTVWVDRSGTGFDTLGAPPELTVRALTDLPDLLASEHDGDITQR
ncbi:haloacid dehalogenase type II [Actinomycetospora sp.]|uniref:haloacid dehalogenase type II n=1 Tax=Actinomycetospora sp. TaxID=1872135 RepID=UPI002F3F827F